jgi:dTDP-4-amino-4,6-dideoxygalactose transaminase
MLLEKREQFKMKKRAFIKGDFSQLAINGGKKAILNPFPARYLLDEQEKKAVAALFDRAIQTGNPFGYNGKEEEDFCKEFASYMGGGFADAVSSGTNAVYVALRAINPEPFTEVIVGPITDPGGIMPIALINCIPMVADAMKGSFNTGPEQIAELISPRTGAIIVPHIFGEPADMKGIMALARKHRIPVIEDCAQAPGATIAGKLVGSFGDIAAFSTMFGKHFCTGGQGGMVYTKSEKLYWACRRLADRGKPFGLPAGSTNCVAALNCNSNDLACVIGSVQLKKLPKIVKRRQELAKMIFDGIADLKAIEKPVYTAEAHPSFWFLRLKFNAARVACNKSQFCKALKEEGLPVRERYISPVCMQAWFMNHCVFGNSGLPWSAPQYTGKKNQTFHCQNALKALDEHFDLPVIESWGNREAKAIIKALRKVSIIYQK